MPIRFPLMHIAESVINRIWNVADEIEAREPSQASGKIDRGAPPPEPMAPDPSVQGAMLDEQLATPAGAMPPAEPQAPPEPGAVAGNIAGGGTALGGLLSPMGGLGGRPMQ
jgi:hypothetical protein